MFFYSEPSQVVVIPLSLLFSTSSLSFSNTTIGTSSQVSFTVSSSGNAVETVSLSDNSNQFAFSPSSFVLTGGLTTQTVTVTFTPTSSGLKTGSLTLSSSGGDIELLSFSGTGRDTYYSNISYQLSISGNNAVDLSSNSSPVTFFGNAQVSTIETKFGGGSIKLDGDGDYVALPSGSQFNFGTDSFTIETWFYISGNSPLSPGNVRYGTLFASYATGGTNTGYQLMVAGNSTTTGTGLAFNQVTNNSSTGLISYDTTIQKNVWNHVAISRDAANNGRTMRMYLNGTLVATSNSWAGVNVQGSGYTPKIGATLYSEVNFYPYYFNGHIEDLRITKGVSRYTSNFTPGQI